MEIVQIQGKMKLGFPFTKPLLSSLSRPVMDIHRMIYNKSYDL